MRTTRLSAMLVAAFMLSVGACANDPTTIIELTVTETIPVDFGQMSGGVAESASVSLADLRDEPDYADNAAAFRCGALDLDASSFTVTALLVGAGATVLTYTVDVAAAGAGSWTTLGSYTGSVTAGQDVSLGDPKFSLSPAGLAQIAQAVLSDQPVLAVRVGAQVPGDLNAMQIALSLSLAFSSDAKGCPSTTTGR